MKKSVTIKLDRWAPYRSREDARIQKRDFDRMMEDDTLTVTKEGPVLPSYEMLSMKASLFDWYFTKQAYKDLQLLFRQNLTRGELRISHIPGRKISENWVIKVHKQKTGYYRIFLDNRFANV